MCTVSSRGGWAGGVTITWLRSPPPRILPGAAQCRVVVLRVISRWSLDAGASRPGFLTSHYGKHFETLQILLFPVRLLIYSLISPHGLLCVSLLPSCHRPSHRPHCDQGLPLRLASVSCRVDHVVAFGKTRMFWAPLNASLPWFHTGVFPRIPESFQCKPGSGRTVLVALGCCS